MFQKLYPEFETNHAKIINKSVFSKEYPDKIIVMSEKNIKTAYQHIVE